MRGRRKIENGVDMIVMALCLDYQRRANAIADGCVTHRTEMEYRYLNFKILTATEEIVGEHDAPYMIKDIGEGIGYAYTELYWMSESVYKTRKKQVRDCIAKKLHLID